MAFEQRELGPRRLMASMALVAVLLAACQNAATPAPGNTGFRLASTNLNDSSVGFGIDLADRLLARPGAGNVVISPLSATLALSMVASGAHGATRAAILSTLGLDPTIDPSTQAVETLARLVQSDPNTQLELADALWAQKGLTMNPTYVTRLEHDYKAQIGSIDFRSPDAPKAVNAWVSAATHQQINQLVDHFDPATVAFLANATYFHGLWLNELFPTQKPALFRTFSGRSISVPMMYNEFPIAFVEAATYEAVLLPYRGGRFSMAVVLPRKQLSPSGFAQFFTLAIWHEVLGWFHKGLGPSFASKKCQTSDPGATEVLCKGTLKFPRVTLDYGADLTSELAQMGMAPARNAAADFSDLCQGCAISTVVQKTHLEIDEKGTTAAAGTGVGIVLSGGGADMVVDHPFALALIDNASDAPLFLGVVGQL